MHTISYFWCKSRGFCVRLESLVEGVLSLMQPSEDDIDFMSYKIKALAELMTGNGLKWSHKLNPIKKSQRLHAKGQKGGPCSRIKLVVGETLPLFTYGLKEYNATKNWDSMPQCARLSFLDHPLELMPQRVHNKLQWIFKTSANDADKRRTLNELPEAMSEGQAL
ncbi:hypothetical protein VNO77_02650 [Canavalia gladiata]|uniref:Uncharacterized protein n=1 Tax=Canavalia gladiata TaxID=3824 RepID=A0AAN9MU11_CANGL